MRCGCVFSRPDSLARHLARKIPCVTTMSKKSFTCEHCNKTFTMQQSLSRHILYRCDAATQIQKLQDELVKIKAKPQVIQNIHITQTTIQALQANVQNVQVVNVSPKSVEPIIPTRVPGWPAKWPVPAITPRPFIPSRFEMNSEMFEQAAARVRNIEGCRQGTVEGVAELAMECVKLIQETPAEQNIFLNPSSRDQGLVYAHPPHWEKMPLREALTIIFTHLAQEIGEVSQTGPLQVREVAQAAKKTLNAKTSDVIQSARSGVVAHLDNLSLRVADKVTDSWLGEIITTPINLRWFGRETRFHLEADATVLAFETMLNVYTVADVTAVTIPKFARQLPSIYARLALARHPENLTVRFADRYNHDVYVHTVDGWQFMYAKNAADLQFRAFARQVVAYIGSQSSMLLMPVSTYITKHIDEITNAEVQSLELLSRYATEATRYYGSMVDIEQTLPIQWTDAEIDELIESIM